MKSILSSSFIFENFVFVCFLFHLILLRTSNAISFSYTGYLQNYTVPSSFYAVNVDITGAAGGGGASAGSGARVQTTLFVTPGSTLYIYVGGRPSGMPGGYNGGGSGTSCAGGWIGYGGGGASDIRIGGTTLSHRQVIAGGGGGYCNWCQGVYSQAGGAGGSAGFNGSSSANSCNHGTFHWFLRAE
jgi:hypothetical protein